MAYTLDQLLEATGVDELAGTPFKKVASPKGPDLLKLAARCREASEAEDAPAAPPADTVNAQGLVEKTAAVAIIRQTLAEISAIEGTPPEAVKTASAGPDQAAFIKAALEEGYSPEDIARFLEQSEEANPRKKKTATSIIG